jgi:hypothetical protein
VAYAAAHVVPLPLADNTPGAPADLDWGGVVEVGIFNADIWASDPDEVVATVKDRWAALVAPSLTSSAPLGTR